MSLKLIKLFKFDLIFIFLRLFELSLIYLISIEFLNQVWFKLFYSNLNKSILFIYLKF